LRINGRRKRLFFRTKTDADRELARIRVKHAREGQNALSIPDSLRIMARDCAGLLEPFGKTLLDATRFYVAHLEASSRSLTLNALVLQYINSKRLEGCSKVHLADLRYRLGTFCRDFGPEPVRTITTASIEHWLHHLELGPQSINNFRLRLAALFNWGVKRQYLTLSPVTAIEPVRTITGPPEIFTPTQLRAVLEHASVDLVPALAIGAFCGMRTSELLRLNWTEVDLARGFVHVAATNAKSARRRLVPVPDNLASWLQPYAGRTGKVWNGSAAAYQQATVAAARAAGLARWPKNGLRHSYASYHLALHQNAAELSLHMGHATPHMVFEHYREVVRPEEGQRYFAIRPPQPPANVVALKLGAGS
jgi:integrase